MEKRTEAKDMASVFYCPAQGQKNRPRRAACFAFCGSDVYLVSDAALMGVTRSVMRGEGMPCRAM